MILPYRYASTSIKTAASFNQNCRKMLRFSRNCAFNPLSTYNKQKICIYIQSWYSSSLNQESNVDMKSSSNPGDHVHLTSTKESEDVSSPNAKNISLLLRDATSNFKVQDVFKALDLLSVLSETENINYKEILNNDNYAKLSFILEKEGRHQNPKDVIKAIKNLLKMGVPSNNFLVESLEHDLLWVVRHAPIFNILLIIDFQVHYQETEKQKKVLEQALLSLDMRWSDITQPKEICFSYSLSTHLPATLLNHIDNCVAENAVNMSLDDLQKILVAMSVSQRRPKPVLHALAYYMSKKISLLAPKQISSVVYALNKLNLPDETLLNKLSSDFCGQISGVNHPSTVRTITLCMGQLKWRDEALLDALAQWILHHIELCRPSDIAILIITMAALSYSPGNIEELLRVCIPHLNPEQIKKSEWIDIVWSLTVLEKASKEHIASVLDPSFIKGLILDDPLNVGTHLKLLNINAVANTLDSYNGPTFQRPLAQNLSITQNCRDLSLRNHVLKVLQKFLPFPKYLSINVNTNMGFTVDAELIVDKHCKPLPIHEYSTSFGEIESIKPLLDGAQKLAVKIWTYKDFTIGTQSLTGRNLLAVKLLNKKGYKVVQLPYYNINVQNTLVQSIHYFEKLIKETVNE